MDRLTDAGPFPRVVLLDTISFCNYRCPNCGYHLMTRKKGHMEKELFKKVINEIAERKPDTRVWMVFFGEALILREKLFDMIKYAKEKGLTDVVLNTNGCLLDSRSQWGLIDSGLDAIYIGIDAMTPHTYRKVRGGDYVKVHDNTKALLATGASKPKVFVQFVEMEENKAERDDFVKYWSGEGAIVKVRPKATFAGAAKPYNVQQVERYPCHWAMQTMSILWDGRVCLCASDYDGRFIAGDINDCSLEEVWLGKLKEIREFHAKGEWSRLPQFCQECSDWQMARAEFTEV